MSELDGWKSFPDIDHNHGLFEVVIDFEKESCGWLLLDQGSESRSMLFPSTK
jgi:hypothetical protein